MNIEKTIKGVIKSEWCERDLADIMRASPAIINGIDDVTAEMLEKHLGIKTIRDLSNSKFFMIARMLEITSLAEGALRHEGVSGVLTFSQREHLIEV
jgi:hypothetical protein